LVRIVSYNFRILKPDTRVNSNQPNISDIGIALLSHERLQPFPDDALDLRRHGQSLSLSFAAASGWVG